MGSSSDWETLQHAAAILAEFGVPTNAGWFPRIACPTTCSLTRKVPLARGLKAIIAGAGGAAHLPGMLAAKTAVPVLGVPVASRHLQGVDSLAFDRADAQGHPSRHASPSARRARPTRRCSRWRCSPASDAALRARLEHYRAAQTAAARAMTQRIEMNHPRSGPGQPPSGRVQQQAGKAGSAVFA